MSQCSPATEVLLPCPFCGSEGPTLLRGIRYPEGSVDKEGAVMCPTCEVRGPLKAWNTRATQPPTGGEVLTVETMREAVQSAVDAVAFPISRRSAGTEDADPEQPYVDMLWQWFEKRRGAEDMRSERAFGLSADDFKNMLDDHEANLLPDPAQSGRNDALRLLADLFTEAEHETWRKEEIVNIIEDAIRLGSPQSSQHHNTAQGE